MGVDVTTGADLTVGWDTGDPGWGSAEDSTMCWGGWTKMFLQIQDKENRKI